MLNELTTARKVRALLIGFGLTFCSMFIGNGYNPLFAVIALVEPSISLVALLSYILFALSKCSVAWSLQGAGYSLILFQLVMMVVGYIPLLTLPALRRIFKEKGFSSGLALTIASAIWYWWLSNSLCFTQMSGLIPSWKCYDLSLTGYLTCLMMGGSFFWHSLVISVPVYCILYALGYFRILFFNECFSYARCRA